MAIDKKQEIQGVLDARTTDARVTDFLSKTNVTLGVLAALGVFTIVQPWAIHIVLPIGLIWWSTVAFDRRRQILPYYLPAESKRIDYNQPLPGANFGFAKANGIMFLGNAVDRLSEVWESSSTARQHKLIFGTTGAGKSELLTGLFVQYLVLGAGCIYSDAKGTPEFVSKLYRVTRRFGRDCDFFSLNYISGGVTVREGMRTRLTNTSNPTGFASADQIIQMFSAFLPKSSGENQIFQERAVTMFAAVAPCLVDLRDLHNEPLGINKIRDYTTNLNNLLELAFDANKKLTESSRSAIRKYLGSLPNFDLKTFLGEGNGEGYPNYPVHAETSRMFGYAAQYFSRALASLSETYRHIYGTDTGELDWLDAVIRRRIVVVSLPALEKAPQELLSLAKINLANLRGAIAIAMGDKVEGRRKEVLDFLPSTAETPTGIILDEYGYQATEGFAITTAQARSLNFAIVIAGQDLSNLEMGSKEEAEAIFGNAVLICLNIRNVDKLGGRVRESVGEADVAVSSGHERRTGGVVGGYMSNLNTSIQRRHRVSPSDLIALNTGEALMFVGRNVGTIRYFPFAPIPKPADYMQINRFLPINLHGNEVSQDIEAAQVLNAWIRRRVEGENPPRETGETSEDIEAILKAARAAHGAPEAYVAALRERLDRPAARRGDSGMAINPLFGFALGMPVSTPVPMDSEAVVPAAAGRNYPLPTGRDHAPGRPDSVPTDLGHHDEEDDWTAPIDPHARRRSQEYPDIGARRLGDDIESSEPEDSDPDLQDFADRAARIEDVAGHIRVPSAPSAPAPASETNDQRRARGAALVKNARDMAAGVKLAQDAHYKPPTPAPNRQQSKEGLLGAIRALQSKAGSGGVPPAQ